MFERAGWRVFRSALAQIRSLFQFISHQSSSDVVHITILSGAL
jgi:hypothetical protein